MGLGGIVGFNLDNKKKQKLIFKSLRTELIKCSFPL